MRILLLIIITYLAVGTLAGQDESPANKRIANELIALYNSGEYDGVFSLYAANMKASFSSDQTTDFLKNLKSGKGLILSKSFIKYDKGFAVYKVNFEKSVLALNISVDHDQKINGLSITKYMDENIPLVDRNSTVLKLPFNGPWTAIWGGDTKELNYHVTDRAQKNAFDFDITDAKGKSHTGNGHKNEDYYAFGQEISAPCDGEVMLAVDGVKDNIPGEMNTYYVPGNSVIIKISKNEFLLFAHFKQGSVKVKEGDKVKQGQVLGLCGNSGNSSEPHLHFHIQNIENTNIATGVKCYFDNIIVNGQLQKEYSPIKNDKVQNQ